MQQVTVRPPTPHSCVLTREGAVRCFGEIYTPVPAGLEAGALSVSAGESGTCAVSAAGAVKCWGGVVDYYPEDFDTSAPELSEGVTSVAFGAYHRLVRWHIRAQAALTLANCVMQWAPLALFPQTRTPRSCAVTAQGAVRCFGLCWVSPSMCDVPAAATSGVVAVAAGIEHTWVVFVWVHASMEHACEAGATLHVGRLLTSAQLSQPPAAHAHSHAQLRPQGVWRGRLLGAGGISQRAANCPQ